MSDVFSQEELEIKILACAISSEDNLLKAINNGITSKHFYYESKDSNIKYYSKIFQIIAEFYARYNEIITFESFQCELDKKKINSDKSIRNVIVSNINQCYSNIVSSDTSDVNYEYLLDDLRDRCIKREVSFILPELKEAFREKSAVSVLDDFIDKLSDIRVSKGNVGQQTLVINAAGSASDIIKLYEEEKEKLTKDGGVKIGLPEIDKATNGFREGQFVVILGEVGKGKSTVLLNWAINAHQNNKNVLFFSFEMPRWQCISRYMGIKTEVPYEYYKNLSLDNSQYDQWKQFLKDEEERNDCYFEFIDQPDNRTVEEVDSRIRKYISADRKPDVVFVDYLGNMALTESSRGMKEYEIISIATVRLRQLARRYRIPVITAQQINREGLKGVRKKEDAREYDKILWQPEMIQDSKKTMDYADFVIGINQKIDREDPSEQIYMCFHKVKARDTHFEPFSTLFMPEISKIIPIFKQTKAIEALFDNDLDIFDKTNIFGETSKTDNYEEDDDIGGLL
jgi:replicative DNA helicase